MVPDVINDTLFNFYDRLFPANLGVENTFKKNSEIYIIGVCIRK